MYFKDVVKEKDNLAFSTSISATTFVTINLFTVFAVLDYYNIVTFLMNKYIGLLITFILWITNYLFFVRKKEFLKYNFKKDKKGGWMIILYIILTFLSFIYIANLNRNKIAQEKKLLPKVEKAHKRPSLEGKIRKWFKENF